MHSSVKNKVACAYVVFWSICKNESVSLAQESNGQSYRLV